MVASCRSTTQRPIDIFDPTKRWCWRDGSSGGEKWRKAVLEAADTLGIAEALVNEPPTLADVQATNTELPSQEQQVLFDATLAAYTALNTRLYKEVIKPSIIHSADWCEVDEEERDALFDHGGVKDGRGYYLWLLPKANTTGLVDQGRYRKVVALLLAPTADRGALDRHMLNHFDAWRHLNTTDVRDARGYVESLIMTMPTEPIGAPLTLVRTKMAESLIDPDWPAYGTSVKVLIENASKHASLLGLVIKNGASERQVMPGIGGALAGNEKKPAGAERRPAGTEDCGRCSAWCCSGEPCLVFADKFDPKKAKSKAGAVLKSGEQYFIKLCRRYVKAHPGTTSLKNVTIKAMRAGIKDSDGDGADGKGKQNNALVDAQQALLELCADANDDGTDSGSFDDWIKSQSDEFRFMAVLDGGVATSLDGESSSAAADDAQLAETAAAEAALARRAFEQERADAAAAQRLLQEQVDALEARLQQLQGGSAQQQPSRTAAQPTVPLTRPFGTPASAAQAGPSPYDSLQSSGSAPGAVSPAAAYRVPPTVPDGGFELLRKLRNRVALPSLSEHAEPSAKPAGSEKIVGTAAEHMAAAQLSYEQQARKLKSKLAALERSSLLVRTVRCVTVGILDALIAGLQAASDRRGALQSLAVALLAFNAVLPNARARLTAYALNLVQAAGSVTASAASALLRRGLLALWHLVSAIPQAVYRRLVATADLAGGALRRAVTGGDGGGGGVAGGVSGATVATALNQEIRAAWSAACAQELSQLERQNAWTVDDSLATSDLNMMLQSDIVESGEGKALLMMDMPNFCDDSFGAGYASMPGVMVDPRLLESDSDAETTSSVRPKPVVELPKCDVCFMVIPKDTACVFYGMTDGGEPERYPICSHRLCYGCFDGWRGDCCPLCYMPAQGFWRGVLGDAQGQIGTPVAMLPPLESPCLETNSPVSIDVQEDALAYVERIRGMVASAGGRSLVVSAAEIRSDVRFLENVQRLDGVPVLLDSGATDVIFRTDKLACAGTYLSLPAPIKTGKRGTCLELADSRIFAFEIHGSDGVMRLGAVRGYVNPNVLCDVLPEHLFEEAARSITKAGGKRMIDFGDGADPMAMYVTPNHMGWLRLMPLRDSTVSRVLLQRLGSTTGKGGLIALPPETLPSAAELQLQYTSMYALSAHHPADPLPLLKTHTLRGSIHPDAYGVHLCAGQVGRLKGFAACCKLKGLLIKDYENDPALGGGPRLDLFNDKVICELYSEACGGKIVLLGAGFPCGTGAVPPIKEGADGGPQPVRTIDYPDGVPNPPADRAAALRFSNELLRRVEPILLAVIANGGDVFVETCSHVGDPRRPLTYIPGCESHSTILHTSPMVRVAKAMNGVVIGTSHCAWGAECKKPIDLLLPGRLAVRPSDDAPSFAERLQQRQCAHTPGQHKDVAFGKLPDGTFKSKTKAAWPDQLCEFLSELAPHALAIVHGKTSPLTGKIHSTNGNTALTSMLGLDHSVLVMAKSGPATRSVGMAVPSFATGVQLLQAMHVREGHLALKPLLARIAKCTDLPKGCITEADIEEYKRRGCRVCDLYLRRTQPHLTVADPTQSPVGKRWVIDILEFKVPTAEHGFVYLGRFVDPTCRIRFSYGMTSYTAVAVKVVVGLHRSVVRPIVGEVYIVKADRHPSHEAKLITAYLADNEVRRDSSVPGHHQGAGEVEITFGIDVPHANALLASSTLPGNKQRHMYTAMLAAEDAANARFDEVSGRSPNELFYSRAGVKSFDRYAYGAPASAVVPLEFRSDKYVAHSVEGWYMGPDRNVRVLDSGIAWVYNGYRHAPVYLRDVTVDERLVFASVTKPGDEAVAFASDVPTAPLDIAVRTREHAASDNEHDRGVDGDGGGDGGNNGGGGGGTIVLDNGGLNSASIDVGTGTLSLKDVAIQKYGEECMMQLAECMTWSPVERREWLPTIGISEDELRALSLTDVADELRAIGGPTRGDDQGQLPPALTRPLRATSRTSYKKVERGGDASVPVNALLVGPQLDVLLAPEQHGVVMTLTNPVFSLADPLLDRRLVPSFEPHIDAFYSNWNELHFSARAALMFVGIEPELGNPYAHAEESVLLGCGDELELSRAKMLVSMDAALEENPACRHKIFYDGTCLIVGSTNSSLEAAINLSDPRNWHTPKNEREHKRCPQRALWDAARDRKWNEYTSAKTYRYITQAEMRERGIKLSEVLRSVWANKIKFNEDGTFNKLAPRWCIVGTNMDRDVYESFSDVVRHSSLKILLAIFAQHPWLWAYYFDVTNAFPTTAIEKGAKPIVVQLPAGQGCKDDHGKDMFAELLVIMQGLIHASRAFGKRLVSLLTAIGYRRATWDRKVFILMLGEIANAPIDLTEKLQQLRAVESSKVDGELVGWGAVGTQVDDCFSLASSKLIADYTMGGVQVQYELTSGTWTRILNWNIVIHPDGRVEIDGKQILQQMVKRVLADDNMYKPRHAMRPSIMKLVTEEAAPEGTLARAEQLQRAATMREAGGCCTWLQFGYPQLVAGTNRANRHAVCPPPDALREIKHALMHVAAHPYGYVYGCEPRTCALSAKPLPPLATSDREPGLHLVCDGNVEDKSVSGGGVWLAGACVDLWSQRQKTKTMGSFPTELNSAVTAAMRGIPLRGLCHELGILQLEPNPIYTDSESTYFTSRDAQSMRNSLWMMNRAEWLQEVVEAGEFAMVPIPGTRNVVDGETKYIPFDVWALHMGYKLGRPDFVDLLKGRGD